MKPYYESSAFYSLYSEFVSSGMDKDRRLFSEAFAPFLVADWDWLVSIFPKGHLERLTYVLYLILRSTKDSLLSFAEIDTSTIESFYDANRELYASLEVTKDTFTHCWQAVYHIRMPDLKGTVSPKLVDTIRFYRQHKVSGLQLVANYCQYNKHRTQLKDAFNPWGEFEQSIKGRGNATEGISIAESAFNMVGGIRNEKPSDIIRAALYPFPALLGQRSDLRVRSNYDGKFESSFFLQQFEILTRNASQLLIVNPGPDFLLAWSQKAKKYACKCCVAVPNIYVAAAYRMEFKNLKFCIFSDTAEIMFAFIVISAQRKFLWQCNSLRTIYPLILWTVKKLARGYVM